MENLWGCRVQQNGLISQTWTYFAVGLLQYSICHKGEHTHRHTLLLHILKTLKCLSPIFITPRTSSWLERSELWTGLVIILCETSLLNKSDCDFVCQHFKDLCISFIKVGSRACGSSDSTRCWGVLRLSRSANPVSVSLAERVVFKSVASPGLRQRRDQRRGYVELLRQTRYSLLYLILLYCCSSPLSSRANSVWHLQEFVENCCIKYLKIKQMCLTGRTKF